MKTVKIPADGQWHTLPHKPISSVIAPTMAGSCEVDMREDGSVRVRADNLNGFRSEVEVKFSGGEPCRAPLVDPTDPPELRPENAEGWNRGG